jgi:hypothetical protein
MKGVPKTRKTLNGIGKKFFAGKVLSILSGQYLIFKIYPDKSVFVYIN